MDAPLRHEVTGLVLAGGRGTRMGGADKGLVEIEGRTLVERVIERLQPQVEALLISANRNLARYREFGFPVLLDAEEGLEPFPGPLAGMLAAMRASTTPWIATAPCDAPFLPLNLVSHLAEALAGAPAAVAYAGERIQPVFCLLHVSLADDLATAMAHGERRGEAWLRGIGAAPALFLQAESFANLNTLQELRTRS